MFFLNKSTQFLSSQCITDFLVDKKVSETGMAFYYWYLCWYERYVIYILKNVYVFIYQAWFMISHPKITILNFHLGYIKL